MTAAGRTQLAAVFALLARFADVPLPHIDESLPSAEYHVAWTRAQRDYESLLQSRSWKVTGHLQYLSGTDDEQPLDRRIQTVTTIMTRDLARPLPYPVADAEVPA